MLSQIISFILGITASFFAWLLIAKVIKPKIEIEDNIEKGMAFVENEKYIYRLGIKNKNLFYKVFDVSIVGSIIIRGLDESKPNQSKSFNIKIGNGFTPYINPYKKCDDNIKRLVIKVPYSNKGHMGQLKKLYCKRKGLVEKDFLNIEEVFAIDSKLDIKFRVAVTCTHNFSGARSIVVKEFCKDNIVNEK